VLLERAIGQQIPGELLDREPVERHVPVERVDDPIPVRPDLSVIVEVEAVGVGVTGRIQPIARPVLAVCGGRQQTVDGLLISVGRLVVDERLYVLG
jgi:hypothetical protein